LHTGFLLPAIGLILGTYYLGRRFTRFPLIAAATCLFTPAFMISATKVMSDTLMVALWLWAVILWFEGLDRNKPLLLGSSGLLIALGALAKYFAASLIPLLLVISLVRKRRLGSWAWYLAIPVLILLGYEIWTRALYGQGLIVEAAGYARSAKSTDSVSWLAHGAVGIAFMGGCTLPELFAAPFVWSRKEILAGAALCGLAGCAVANGWLASTAYVPGSRIVFVGAQFALYLAGGLSILGLAVSDLRRTRNSSSLLLTLWVLGTLIFSCFLNWTVNARSILPMIPAVGILMARRFELKAEGTLKRRIGVLAGSLLVPGIISLWVASSDAALAGSARDAASTLQAKARNYAGALRFEGHWGFQFYMESTGAQPLDSSKVGDLRGGDIVIIPVNNTGTFDIDPRHIESRETIEIGLRQWVGTMKPELGAGFYSSMWGPLPFAFGAFPSEQYRCIKIRNQE
jgi:4-amino-4-deoxy-L-arabinose transferase-like glycosyltransferase